MRVLLCALLLAACAPKQHVFREPPTFRITPTVSPTATPVPVHAASIDFKALGTVQQQITRAWPGADDWVLRVVRCETGGTFNPRIVSRSGKYRGLAQFDIRTWRSVGGDGDPAQATVGEQIDRMWRLYQARGWHPWPHCGRPR